MHFVLDSTCVDWPLLRKQKLTLVESICKMEQSAGSEFEHELLEHHKGLLGLIDYIQDSAAEVLGEDAVFDLGSDSG